METTKSRLQDVHGGKQTNKPEKLSPVKNKKITEMNTAQIEKVLHGNQISHVNESVGKQLCTMNVGKQQNLVSTTTEEMEIH
jgi:hypothetical protein